MVCFGIARLVEREPQDEPKDASLRVFRPRSHQKILRTYQEVLQFVYASKQNYMQVKVGIPRISNLKPELVFWPVS